MRAILVTDSAVTTDRDRDLITAFLEGKGWSVWHWFNDLWLIDGAPDNLELKQLRAEIQDILPVKRRMMVMAAEGTINHAGWISTASKPWLQEHWRKR